MEKTGVTFNHWQANAWPLDDSLHPIEWIIQRSCETIARAKPEKPLFLTASFYAPHPPLFPLTEYFEKYLAQELPPPALGSWVNPEALSSDGDKTGHRVLLEGEPLRRAQAGYYGLIEQLDRGTARLVQAFTARSDAAGRPWVIALTSDHGEMLGDHGYFRKCEPYEGSANIPFVFCASPDLNFQTDQICDQPVCLEDIMPTLLELAGAERPAPLDGVNLTPLLRGDTRRVRDTLHFEHAPCYDDAQAFHALTDGQYKYIWRPADGSEHLFNLHEDGCESCNLAASPEAADVLAKWQKRMIEQLRHRPEGFVQNGQLTAGRPYPKLNDGTL